MIARAFALAGVVLALLTALPAAAHVTVRPKAVAAGAVADLTFRCPNERSNSGTVKLVVQLPADVAIAHVAVPELPGWQHHVALRPGTSVVDTITWSGGRIAPGGRENFPIQAGPIPRTAHPLVFKAVQTYDDGEVVRWIQLRVPGQAEPPFPAPQVEVH